MISDDLTLRILAEMRHELRDETRKTRLHIDLLGARVGQLEGRVGGVECRVGESEIRTATAIHDLAGTLRDVRDLLRDRLALRDRVARCERDLGELRRRRG